MLRSKVKTIYSKDYKELAEKMRRARKEAGLTQVQAARKLERPQSYISKIEAAQYYLDVFELKRLAVLYGKSISYFLGKIA